MYFPMLSEPNDVLDLPVGLAAHVLVLRIDFLPQKAMPV
jgi:hypothetical protein